MSSGITIESTNVLNIGMGESCLVETTDVAKSVLGSCIGLVLMHRNEPISAIAHIVLANGNHRSGLPGKFANTAIPWMIEQFQLRGLNRSHLIAKVAGGSNMLASNGPLQIGAANHAAVTEILEKNGIPIVAEHVGGRKGRRVTLEGSTGKYSVEVIGEPVVIL